MQRSRRRVLALLSSAALPAAAGCADGDAATTDDGRTEGTPTGETPTERAPTEEAQTEDAETEDTTAGADGASDPALVVLVDGPDGERTFFDGTDVATVGEVEAGPSGGYRVPVELSEAGTERASEAFRSAGGGEAPEETTVTIEFDGESRRSFGVRRDLAAEIASGEWTGEFVLLLADEATAESVRETLRSE